LRVYHDEPGTAGEVFAGNKGKSFTLFREPSSYLQNASVQPFGYSVISCAAIPDSTEQALLARTPSFHAVTQYGCGVSMGQAAAQGSGRKQPMGRCYLAWGAVRPRQQTGGEAQPQTRSILFLFEFRL
jgi:hypothetical protein